MAENYDNFNYGDDDNNLDENGLPIYTDDQLENQEESSDNLIDYIRQAQGDNNETQALIPSSNQHSNTQKDEESPNIQKKGGRYGDTPPTNSKSLIKPNSGSNSGGSGVLSKLKSGADKLNQLSDSTNNVKDSLSLEKQAEKLKQQAKEEVKKKAKQAILKAITPALPYLGIALLILLAIIFVIILVSSIMAFFDNKTNPEQMRVNTIITSEHFYGTRSVYVDEEKLINALQLSYKQYVVDMFEDIGQDNTLTISVTLPEGDFDNSTEIDSHITNLSLSLANIVATGNNNYSGIEFETLYPQIKYFGITHEQGNLFNNFASQYISNYSLITSDEAIDIDELVDNAMGSEDLQYIYNICEKVMIKDEITTENGITGLDQRNYIASIYMPNKNIIIDSSIYVVSSTVEEFNCTSKLIHNVNGTETILGEKETTDNRDIITGFIMGNYEVSQFTGIDTQNPTAFNKETTLFDVIKKLGGSCFSQIDDEGTMVYTWKPGGETNSYYLTFEDASDKFIFNDFELKVN